MRKLAIGLLWSGLLALAGCANPPGAAPGAAPETVASASAAGATGEEAPLTGSRLKRKTTDRLLRTVGAQDARNAIDSSPDPLKSGQ